MTYAKLAASLALTLMPVSEGVVYMKQELFKAAGCATADRASVREMEGKACTEEEDNGEKYWQTVTVNGTACKFTYYSDSACTTVSPNYTAHTLDATCQATAYSGVSPAAWAKTGCSTTSTAGITEGEIDYQFFSNAACTTKSTGLPMDQAGTYKLTKGCYVKTEYGTVNGTGAWIKKSERKWIENGKVWEKTYEGVDDCSGTVQSENNYTCDTCTAFAQAPGHYLLMNCAAYLGGGVAGASTCKPSQVLQTVLMAMGVLAFFGGFHW